MDGGITKGLETTTTVTWSDISKNGLNITQFYGIGIPSNNTDFILAVHRMVILSVLTMEPGTSHRVVMQLKPLLIKLQTITLSIEFPL